MNQETNNSGCRNGSVVCTKTSVKLEYFHGSCACPPSFVWNWSRKGCCVFRWPFLTTQDEFHIFKNSWLKEKSSRYWMPLTTLSINTQENHCVRHSKGSYQSRDISHTDIHSHARTHVRDSMHCFWKFWSHNTSIFSSTSCNWQPLLSPHGIIQGHLKWEVGGKERKRKHTLRFSNVSRVKAVLLLKNLLLSESLQQMKANSARLNYK